MVLSVAIGRGGDGVGDGGGSVGDGGGGGAPCCPCCRCSCQCWCRCWGFFSAANETKRENSGEEQERNSWAKMRRETKTSRCTHSAGLGVPSERGRAGRGGRGVRGEGGRGGGPCMRGAFSPRSSQVRSHLLARDAQNNPSKTSMLRRVGVPGESTRGRKESDYHSLSRVG